MSRKQTNDGTLAAADATEEESLFSQVIMATANIHCWWPVCRVIGVGKITHGSRVQDGMRWRSGADRIPLSRAPRLITRRVRPDDVHAEPLGVEMRIKVSGIRALAVAVTMALGVVAGLAFARPAYATPTLFENGGVYKFKTTWGGGFVLNTGAENGSMASGENAQVHWNRNWDNNNRWEASSEWLEFGHRWYMFRNRWAPKLCLYAPPGGNDVEQRPCDVNRDEFYWAFDAVAWGSDAGQIKNLAYYRQSSGYSLSQDSAQLFSRVHMAFGNFWATQFWTTKRCAGSGLPELKSC